MRANHGRIQGRAGMELRKRRLAQEPLCRHCAERGITTGATTPDHILPLSMGGTDTDDNIQCLCDDCHNAKTASEANGYAAANHPDWLGPSAIPLTIVSGPPASGKTTYLKDKARPGDIVVDLDGIMRRLRPTYTHWSGALDKGLFNRAIRERNTMLGRLKNESGKRAWFIISAPTQAERDWWQGKLGGEVVLLHPGVEECKRRAIERGTPSAIAGIDRWERASRQPWQAPKAAKAKQQIGPDGWPID
jgi:hypothetical protein